MRIARETARRRFVVITPAPCGGGASYRGHTRAKLERIAARAHRAGREVSNTSPVARAQRWRVLVRLLRARCDELAGIATAETGKPIGQAHGEAEKSALLCDRYAALRPRLLADEHPGGATPGASTMSVAGKLWSAERTVENGKAGYFFRG